MINKILLLLFSIAQAQMSAQFNNVYFTSGDPVGSVIGIKENNSTGEYFIPLGYSFDLTNPPLDFLKVYEDGTLNELQNIFDVPSNDIFVMSNNGFFKTNDDGFVIAGNSNSNDVIKIDENLNVIWELDYLSDLNLSPWGGGELGNGDLILSIIGGTIPWNILKISRFSGQGQLLDQFDVELDYDFSYPSTFITKDSLVYISFPRLLLGEYRRNYIVCYNAITGQELWETHQIEDDQALGFTDGFLCMTSDGQLKFVFVEMTGLNFGSFDTGWQGYFKVVNIDPQTGEMSGESVLSDLGIQSYVLDVAATEDGGLAFLFWATLPENNLTASFGIMKLNSAMELEWRKHYYQPLDLEIGENGSYLIELETTSDDCIVAVGNAQGIFFPEQELFQYPWVLKVDACGNEMVSDCTLSGVGELSQEQTITIYPNPARDRIFLKGENTIQRAMIYDLKGQLVHDERFSGSLQQTLFVDHLPTGLYVVKAMTNKGEWSSERIMVSGEHTR